MEDKRVCVVCPVCGADGEYEIDERYTVFDDEAHIVEYCAGACPNCDTELHWKQVYELIRVENVRAV